MLRRLRWKFILIIMLLVSAVLATVLTVQTGSAIRQFQGETDRVLQAALQRVVVLGRSAAPVPRVQHGLAAL